MKSLKQITNQLLSQAGAKIPGTSACGTWWGEVELPECLREELENSESAQKKAE